MSKFDFIFVKTCKIWKELQFIAWWLLLHKKSGEMYIGENHHPRFRV
jgi:hypothetical protein